MRLDASSLTVMLLCSLALAVPSAAIAQDEASASGTANAAIEAVAKTEAQTDVPVAADSEPPAPGISVEALTERNFLSNASLSRDGKLLGHFISRDDIRMLAIFDVETRELVKLFAPPEGTSFRNWHWAGSRRVLITGRRFSVASLFYFGIPRTTTSVFDLDTGESHFIGFSKQGMEGDDILHVDPAGRFVILSVSDGLLTNPDVWRFPLDGSGPDAAVKVQPRRKGIDEWYADDAGTVRLGMRYDGTKKASFYYRSGPGAELERVAKIRLDDEAELDSWGVIRLSTGSDLGYALVEGANGRKELRQFDFATGQAAGTVYANADWDVSGALFDEDGTLAGATYVDDVERRIWFDPAMAQTVRQLGAALGPGEMQVLDRAENGTLLIWHGSSADPGVLYIFHPRTGELAVYSELRPGLDETQLAAKKTVSYTARDGVRIRAYLTLPKGREGPFPLIVMPHGGPYGVRDTLDYEDDVQLLATRGYAVLQPNFRGSEGFGRAFEDLGEGAIGRAMQDDLDDATAWAIAEGHAVADRVCLVGGSYGGYAALWGVIRNPEIYRCAASWAGVTDLNKQIKSTRGAFISRKAGRRWRDRLEGEGTGEEFDLDEVSPARNADRLTRPVLLAHGTSDDTVPFEQYELMVEAAEKAGKELETLKISGEEHSFFKSENKAKWYTALLDFLQKHNPPAPVPELGTGAAGQPGAVEK